MHLYPFKNRWSVRVNKKSTERELNEGCDLEYLVMKNIDNNTIHI